ncbi:hypothetical protein CK820_G0048800 [Pan troglodytes]|uniref:Uncharacterized protein n=1 Tax=Pan troglodytes TaxID=9598 RepID=A0A2J8JC98_PANTR|nr:hypothetical protein CK820_G0048800 [Pan troglodytes]
MDGRRFMLSPLARKKQALSQGPEHLDSSFLTACAFLTVLVRKAPAGGGEQSLLLWPRKAAGEGILHAKEVSVATCL